MLDPKRLSAALCDRRKFLKYLAAASALGYAACANPTKTEKDPRDDLIEDPIMPLRPLGRAGISISMLSFGGGSRFMAVPDGEWEPMMERALQLGVNFFDTSDDYGSEERFAEILPAVRTSVHIATKFNSRDPDAMEADLAASLARLKTDYVDVLFIHSISDSDTLVSIAGLYERMRLLKEQGVIRSIGFSSMNSASRSKELLDNLEFDVAMLAINPTNYLSYATEALPAARAKNVGVIAMKTLRYLVGSYASAEELIRYALSLDGVASAVIAHENVESLIENAQTVMNYSAEVPAEARAALESRLVSLADSRILRWGDPKYVDGRRAV